LGVNLSKGALKASAGEGKPGKALPEFRGGRAEIPAPCCAFENHLPETPIEPEEIEILEKLLEAGATQFQIAAALPHRTWEKIRKRIRTLQGTGFEVSESGDIRPRETFRDYVERKPSTAIAMDLSISGNSSRQKRSNQERHREGVPFNLAALLC
jgi:hypothetical protein